jgi:hypothetical protein
LEHKTNKIISKQALRRIKALRREGIKPKQIANQLNAKEILSPGEAKKWQAKMFADLIEGD